LDKEAVKFAYVENIKYPDFPPFDPPVQYPEYAFSGLDPSNQVYHAVRELFIGLELDKAYLGTKDWNPLGELIKPGDHVVIKPNFVSEPRSKDVDGQCIITHGSVLRPVIDYCEIALKGKGTLAIADAPQTDSDFNRIREISSIDQVLDLTRARYPVKVDLIDLREEWAETRDGVIINRVKLPGDPKGYTIVDLGDKSAFHDVDPYMAKAYGADYDYGEVRKHHTHGKHEYMISNTILDADVVINLPKLKTHKKAGITACLKNMVGINGNKNYLPHYRFGSRPEGGDEYEHATITKKLGSGFFQYLFKSMPAMGPFSLYFIRKGKGVYSYLHKTGQMGYSPGNWIGNDTIWRVILDINTILFYCDRDGVIQKDIQRKYFALVDGVIAGEGDGPLFSMAKKCGVLLCGCNPVRVDIACAGLMGYDWEKIPHLKGNSHIFTSPIAIDHPFHFKPACGWEILAGTHRRGDPAGEGIIEI
jgi:uncharacterized protein (DUF362 family)